MVSFEVKKTEKLKQSKKPKSSEKKLRLERRVRFSLFHVLGAVVHGRQTMVLRKKQNENIRTCQCSSDTVNESTHAASVIEKRKRSQDGKSLVKM